MKTQPIIRRAARFLASALALMAFAVNPADSHAQCQGDTYAAAFIEYDANYNINAYASYSGDISGYNCSVVATYVLNMGEYGTFEDYMVEGSDGFSIHGQPNTYYSISVDVNICTTWGCYENSSAEAGITTSGSSGSSSSSGSPNSPGPPEIDSINPTYGAAGDTNLAMNITGDNLDPSDGSLVVSTVVGDGRDFIYPNTIWGFAPAYVGPYEIDGVYSIDYYSNPSECYIGAIEVQTSGGQAYSRDFNICYP